MKKKREREREKNKKKENVCWIEKNLALILHETGLFLVSNVFRFMSFKLENKIKIALLLYWIVQLAQDFKFKGTYLE